MHIATDYEHEWQGWQGCNVSVNALHKLEVVLEHCALDVCRQNSLKIEEESRGSSRWGIAGGSWLAVCQSSACPEVPCCNSAYRAGREEAWQGRAGKGDDSLGHAGSGGDVPAERCRLVRLDSGLWRFALPRVEGSGSSVVGRGSWVRGRPRTGRDVDRHTARADRKSRPGRRPIGRYNRGPSTTQEFASTSFA
jgi:hypothetical protein